jgi:hypothetical protein
LWKHLLISPTKLSFPSMKRIKCLTNAANIPKTIMSSLQLQHKNVTPKVSNIRLWLVELQKDGNLLLLKSKYALNMIKSLSLPYCINTINGGSTSCSCMPKHVRVRPLVTCDSFMQSPIKIDKFVTTSTTTPIWSLVGHATLVKPRTLNQKCQTIISMCAMDT